MTTKAIKADQRTLDWVMRIYGLLCMLCGGVIGFMLRGVLS